MSSSRTSRNYKLQDTKTSLIGRRRGPYEQVNCFLLRLYKNDSFRLLLYLVGSSINADIKFQIFFRTFLSIETLFLQPCNTYQCQAKYGQLWAKSDPLSDFLTKYLTEHLTIIFFFFGSNIKIYTARRQNKITHPCDI